MTSPSPFPSPFPFTLPALTDPTPNEAVAERARLIRQHYMKEMAEAGILDAARAASSRRLSKPANAERARDTKTNLARLIKGPSFGRTQFFRSTYDLSDGANLFHFRVWLEVSHFPTDDLTFIEFPQDVRPWLCFNTQDDLDAFEQWMVFYETRWGGPFNESQTPKLPPGPHKVVLLPLPQRLKDETNAIQFMAWYATMCEGHMWVDTHYVFFENEDDAMSFRMRWT